MKLVRWVGSSRKDLKEFPHKVQKAVGYALHSAQLGKMHADAKPLKGFSGVTEIVTNYDSDTYRTVYAVKLGDNLYVLHAFQKKSKRGIATPPRDMELIRKRLREAGRMENNILSETEIYIGSGNVFEDLGFKNPKEELAKANLTFLLAEIIRKRKLTQKEIGRILGVDQPKISALTHGRITGFSIERLFSFLLALDNDIEIIVKPKSRRKHAEITVHPA